MGILLQQSFLLLLLLVFGAYGQSIDQLFTVDASCKNINMNQVLTDARTLASSALIGISNLQGSNMFLTTATRNYMRNAANNFATQYYTKIGRTGLSSVDQTTLTEVQNNFEQIQILLDGGTTNNNVQLTAGSTFITCDGSIYQTTTDATLIEPDLEAGTTTQQAYGYPFVYYVPNRKDPTTQIETIVMGPPAERLQDRAPLCTGNVATTKAHVPMFTALEPYVQVILCDPLFVETSWRRTINASPTANEQKAQWKFLPGAFLHEMFHIWSNTFYERQFYDEKSVNPQTGRAPLPLQVYGPANTYAIAHAKSGIELNNVQITGDNTLNQPDAYRLFAEECQFPKTTWSVSAPGL